MTNPPVHGRIYIMSTDAHRAAMRRYQVRRWAEREEAGKCLDCGKSELATKRRCKPCSQKVSGYARELRSKRRAAGKCIRCGATAALPDRPNCGPCSQHINEAQRTRYRAIKQTVLNGYGNKCACCGLIQFEFLSIDHLEDVLRRNRAEGNFRFYRKIIEAGFPPSLRLLCVNCNLSLGCHGYCPHQGDGGLVDGVAL